MPQRRQALNVSGLGKAKLNIDVGVKRKTSEKTKLVIEDEPYYKCTCCGKKYEVQRSNFPTTASPLYTYNNGFLPICKKCVDLYYIQLVDSFDGDDYRAIERCCQMFDWYYNERAAELTISFIGDGKTRICLYPAKMNMFKAKGTIYADTLKERINNTINSVEDLEDEELNPKDDKGKNTIKPQDVAFFGAGYNADEYIFLRAQYNDWVKRYTIDTKALEELVKNICIMQLTIQQAKKNNLHKETVDAMKTLQDLLGSAKLKPNQSKDNGLVEQNTFGTLIEKWEEEKPIPEASEEFKDVDGIKKYIETFFLGHLADAMDIQNDYSEKYREEIGKYTVHKMEYQGDEDDEAFMLMGDEEENEGNEEFGSDS